MPIEFTIFFRKTMQYPIWQEWLRELVTPPLKLSEILMSDGFKYRYEVSMWESKIVELETCPLTENRLQILFSQISIPNTSITQNDSIPDFIGDFCLALKKKATRETWGLDAPATNDGEILQANLPGLSEERAKELGLFVNGKIINKPLVRLSRNLFDWERIEWNFFWGFMTDEEIRSLFDNVDRYPDIRKAILEPLPPLSIGSNSLGTKDFSLNQTSDHPSIEAKSNFIGNIKMTKSPSNQLKKKGGRVLIGIAIAGFASLGVTVTANLVTNKLDVPLWISLILFGISVILGILGWFFLQNENSSVPNEYSNLKSGDILQTQNGPVQKADTIYYYNYAPPLVQEKYQVKEQRDEIQGIINQALEALKSPSLAVRKQGVDTLADIAKTSSLAKQTLIERVLNHPISENRFLAAVALAQLGDASGLNQLLETFVETNNSQREVAVDTLIKLGRVSIPGVGSILINSTDRLTQNLAINIFEGVNDRSATPFLLTILEGKKKGVYERAIEVLAKLQDPSAIKPLIRLLGETGGVHHAATQALIKIGAESIPNLCSVLAGDDPIAKRFAAYALGRIADASSLECLLSVLNEQNGYLDSDIDVPLHEIAIAVDKKPLEDKYIELQINQINPTEPNFWRGIDLALKSTNLWTRVAAVFALVQIGDKQAKDKLIQVLQNEAYIAQVKAAEALGFMGDKDTLPELDQLIRETKDDTVRETATKAIKRINSQLNSHFGK